MGTQSTINVDLARIQMTEICLSFCPNGNGVKRSSLIGLRLLNA